MKDTQNSWGGSRPNSGMKPRWNSGVTKPLRLPLALHDDCLWFAQLIDGQFPSGQQASDVLACQLPRSEKQHETVTQSREVTEPQDTLDKIRALIAEYRLAMPASSPRWSKAKQLIADLEDLLDE
jgi:hypothetical protein